MDHNCPDFPLFSVQESDQHFELDTLWLEDIIVILCVLIVFSINLMSLTSFRFYGKYVGNGIYSEDLVHVNNDWKVNFLVLLS